MTISCIISEIKWDIGRKCSYPACIRRPRRNFCTNISLAKTRMVKLKKVKCENTKRWYRDGRTERQTEGHCAVSQAALISIARQKLYIYIYFFLFSTTRLVNNYVCIKSRWVMSYGQNNANSTMMVTYLVCANAWSIIYNYKKQYNDLFASRYLTHTIGLFPAYMCNL